VMNDVEDVWWCRTPKNSVVYGSGERRIRGQRRIALHYLYGTIATELTMQIHQHVATSLLHKY
jgi:hypothetical protein